MLHFGMPTLIENRTPADCAALCGQLGLSFVELNMNLPDYQLHTMDVDKLRALGEEHGLYYTIHLDENFNPCDFNPAVAQAYLDTAAGTVAMAARLGAPVVNMHLSRGVYFTLPGERVYLYHRYREDYLRGICVFRDTIGPAAEAAGVTVCVENSDGYTDFQLEALDLMLEHSAFALTFDVGHDHAIGGADRPLIMEREQRLRHMHLHDAAEGKNHLALGTGRLDADDCLALARRHDCRVVVETKTVEGLRQSVEWLRQKHYLK